MKIQKFKIDSVCFFAITFNTKSGLKKAGFNVDDVKMFSLSIVTKQTTILIEV